MGATMGLQNTGQIRPARRRRRSPACCPRLSKAAFKRPSTSADSTSPGAPANRASPAGGWAWHRRASVRRSAAHVRRQGVAYRAAALHLAVENPPARHAELLCHLIAGLERVAGVLT